MRHSARLLSLILALATTPLDGASVRVSHLRAGGVAQALGLDDPQPVLSWQLASARRGAHATAFRVQVASTPELLAADRPDLWDSGRIEDPVSLRALYAGRPLRSSQQVFWRVRTWDEAGEPSAWSEPASWTTGLLDDSEPTRRAPWITDPGLLPYQRQRLGFSTPPSADLSRTEWLQVDLGSSLPIDGVNLHAVRHLVSERLGFPRRFKVEAGDHPDLRDARLILDHTDRDYPNSWANLIRIPGNGAFGRYLRVTASRLRDIDGLACFALSQLEILSQGRNVAAGRPVTASAAMEDVAWSLASVVDGVGLPGTNPRANETLLFRRAFAVHRPLRRALLHVSGLGHYALAVNGRAVGEARFTPGWTDYTDTILYDTHDLTNLLLPGPNALGLILAGGMYNVAPGRYVKFTTPFRPLVAWAELHLEYEDGSIETVPTDSRWRVHPGPTHFANIYGGEDHDARREPAGWSRPGFDDRGWSAAVSAPDTLALGRLRGAAHAGPPIRPQEELAPRAIRELRPDVHVYDFGQNTAMMPRLRVSGPAGATVRLIPAELLREDGSVDRRNVGGDAWWQYTLRGDPAGESWEPHFFYHGARYLQVELSAPAGADLPRLNELMSVVVHADVLPAGEFACSNELFNRIHALVRWAQRSNLFHVLTDCPHRERLGWLEQYHLNGPALRYNWDLTRLFRKTFQDMADAQAPSGLIPGIAPEYVAFEGGFRDSPEWGSALILAAWQHYQWSGDDSPLRRHYDAMRRYFAYLGSKKVKDAALLDHGLGDWYDVGPERPGVAQLTPVALTASAIYYEDARTLANIAAHLGHATDAALYRSAADDIRAAFNLRFLNSEKSFYASGSQTAQALPLVLGLVPDDHRAGVLAALLRDIESRAFATSAGDVGYRYVLRALADAGRSDVILKMTNQTERPGYGYQLARGATSLTEAWSADPRVSQNHFMLGQINEWFFHDLAGIQPAPAAPGFRHLVLAPAVVDGIDWVSGSYQTPAGLVRSEWSRQQGTLVYRVTIPPGATATVRLPATDAAAVQESGQPAARAPHVRLLRATGRIAEFAVSSGTYEFSTPVSTPRPEM